MVMRNWVKTVGLRVTVTLTQDYTVISVQSDRILYSVFIMTQTTRREPPILVIIDAQIGLVTNLNLLNINMLNFLSAKYRLLKILYKNEFLVYFFLQRDFYGKQFGSR